jgi:hypothetical protein
MGHYCRICGHEHPSEQFSGKGHKIQVCKLCKARAKSERQAIEDEGDIFGFLKQSHISESNVARLEQLAPRTIRELPPPPQLFWMSPALSRTKPETQVPCTKESGSTGQVAGHGFDFCPPHVRVPPNEFCVLHCGLLSS